MKKTTVYLTSEQKRWLARAAKLERRSEADLIREGIEAITNRHRAAEPTIPLFTSGVPDLATRAGDYAGLDLRLADASLIVLADRHGRATS